MRRFSIRAGPFFPFSFSSPWPGPKGAGRGKPAPSLPFLPKRQARFQRKGRARRSGRSPFPPPPPPPSPSPFPCGPQKSRPEGRFRKGRPKKAVLFPPSPLSPPFASKKRPGSEAGQDPSAPFFSPSPLLPPLSSFFFETTWPEPNPLPSPLPPPPPLSGAKTGISEKDFHDLTFPISSPSCRRRVEDAS